MTKKISELTPYPGSAPDAALMEIASGGTSYSTPLSDVRTGGINNVVEDTSPQLGGNLDSNGFDVWFDDDTGLVDSNGNEQLITKVGSATADEFLYVKNNLNGSTLNGRTLGPGLYAQGSTTDPHFTLGTVGPGGERAVLELRGQPTYDSNGSYSYLRVTGGQNHAAVIIEGTTDNSSHAPIDIRCKGTDSIRLTHDTTASSPHIAPVIEIKNIDTTSGDCAPYTMLYGSEGQGGSGMPNGRFLGGHYWGGVDGAGSLDNFNGWMGITATLLSNTAGAVSVTGKLRTFVSGSDVVHIAWDSNTVYPGANSTQTLGKSGTAWLRTYTDTLKLTPIAFGSLPTPAEGMIASISDSNTATWGATIAGGGTNKVLGYYNGTNWKVAAA